MKIAEYVVTTNDQQLSAWQAEDISNLLAVLFEYNGCKKDILNRALIGCKTVPEKIEMYNYLMPYDTDKITRIREVKERIYG